MRCLSPLNSEVKGPVGRDYNWIGDHMVIDSPELIVELVTYGSRIDLSPASSVFLRVLQFFPSGKSAGFLPP